MALFVISCAIFQNRLSKTTLRPKGGSDRIFPLESPPCIPRSAASSKTLVAEVNFCHSFATTVAKSAFFPHYKRVAELVRKRIVHGDYALKPIPSERRLAEEIGVNYMTVRRGLQILEQEGLIARLSNGRLRVKHAQQGSKKHFNFALLMPTMASRALEIWRWTLEKATENLPCSVRPVLYMHWDDPILSDALEGFDGIFLSPIPAPIPEATASRLRDPRHPVVVIDHDFTSYGIPSIQLFPPTTFQRLLDHLETMGHTCIGCLNTQPSDFEVSERITQWRYWMAAHGFSGRLLDQGVAVHGDPIQRAYQIMTETLDAGDCEETAWFCTTSPAALGAMRAMLDHGIAPGRDVAICAVNDEGFASMLNPPLTTLDTPDPLPFISYCLQWMMGDSRTWEGPLLMQPAAAPLEIRESTQPKTAAGRKTSFPAKATR